MPKIIPTVGRVVWLYDAGEAEPKPIAAIIAHVWTDSMINVAAFDRDGRAFTRTSVRLLQDGEQPAGESYYCRWMPYQIGQAAKTEQVLSGQCQTAEAVAPLP